MGTYIKFISLILFFSHFSASLLGQFGEWDWVDPSPQGNDLAKVAQIPGTGKFVTVGATGVFMVSEDAGATWIANDSLRASFASIDGDFKDVFFVDSLVGYIVGSAQLILKTTNGGTSWDLLSFSSDWAFNYHSVYFLNPDTGFVGGAQGFLLKTTDGGLNWMLKPSNTTTKAIHSLTFTNDQTGYAIYDNVIIKTTDQGDSWFVHKTFSGIGAYITSISFTSEDTLYVCTMNDKRVWKSTNGGISISVVLTPPADNLNIYDSYFPNDTLGYLLTHKGIYVTIDAGVTWDLNPIIDSLQFSAALSFIGGVDTMIAVGKGGVIYQSVNGSINWSNMTSQETGSCTTCGVYSFSFPNDSVGFALSAGMYDYTNHLYKTNDRGLSWTKSLINPSFFHAVQFMDSLNGYASSNDEILKTIDGGNSWTVIHNSFPLYNTTIGWYSVVFRDSLLGYCIGSDGKIIKTKDAGVTWDTLASFTSKDLNEIQFTSDSVGYIMTYGSTLLKSVDGGSSWFVQHDMIGVLFLDMYFLNDSVGYICGGDKRIYKTTDGGATFTISLDNCNRAYSVFFVDENTGFAAGIGQTCPNSNLDRLWKTEDGGVSWQKQSSFMRGSHGLLFFPDPSFGFVTGQQGSIMRIECPTPSATVSMSGPTTFCQGGTVSLTASSGNTYLWSDGSTTPSITVNTSGTYDVQIFGANGCSSLSEKVKVVADQTATIIQGDTMRTCVGESVNLSASTASSYLWSTGDTTQIITVPDSGTYTVTTTNSCGVTASAPIYIEAVSYPLADMVSVTNLLCYNDSNGSISLIVSSGTPPYSYVWSSGSFSSSEANLSAGNYSITISDTYGCEDTAFAEVTEPAALQIAVTENYANQGLCNGSASIITSGGMMPYTYEWTNAQSQVISNNSMADSLCPGTQYLTILDAYGCELSSSLIILDTSTIIIDIEQLSDIGSLEIYPNPTTGKISIDIYMESRSNLILEVFNSFGQIVIKQNLGICSGLTTKILDLSDNPSGVYALRARSDDQVVSRIIILDN